MLSCLFVSIFMQTDRAGLLGTPNIDHALIGAAAPAELCVLLRFDERPVHDNIYGIKKRQICDLLPTRSPPFSQALTQEQTRCNDCRREQPYRPARRQQTADEYACAEEQHRKADSLTAAEHSASPLLSV